MVRFLIDEDLPRSLAGALRAVGFDAVDVRDIGLRSADDTFVFVHAVEERRCRLSGAPATVIAAVIGAMRYVDEAQIRGGLMVIEPARVRLRPAP